MQNMTKTERLHGLFFFKFKVLTAELDPVHLPHGQREFDQRRLVQIIRVFQEVVGLLLQSFNDGVNCKQMTNISISTPTFM